ncbi:BolA family transcriptional regulator [Candidatus Thiomargarita nelsonii]|uniref:BolA family transcriptional regulator n=1 Tax=Candidatus Thiomargarita nelsonii TaxID=1003181 RepID=A0A0A6PAU2_9GAMM|nr:BolA family transcriptional regulator [Candidatus Thiomargarita nelsonii]
MQPKQVKTLIETALAGAQAEIKSDDNTHFEAIVIYEDFANKSTVKQHQMVYGALGDSIQSNAIHALSLKTYTPQEWEQTRKNG